MHSRIGLVVALTLLAANWVPPCPSWAGQSTTPGLTQEQERLAALLPGDGEIPGWKKAKAPDFYGPENLWDCIDGAAVLYLDYGFQSLVAVHYTAADGASTAAIEIYRMDSPLDAFAIFAAERSPKDDFIRVGVQGYQSDYVLNFWKGPYYTKLTSYKTTSEEKGVLRKLAGIVADRIPGQYAEPEAFRYFPEKHRLPGTERYIPKNFLGHPFLKGGYRVDYQGEKRTYQLFLVPNGSKEEAEAAFGKYREHLATQYAGVSLKKRGLYQTMRGGDRETVFLYGSFVGGVLGEADAAHALELADEVVNNLTHHSAGNPLQQLTPTAPDSPDTAETGPAPGRR